MATGGAATEVARNKSAKQMAEVEPVRRPRQLNPERYSLPPWFTCAVINGTGLLDIGLLKSELVVL